MFIQLILLNTKCICVINKNCMKSAIDNNHNAVEEYKKSQLERSQAKLVHLEMENR